MKIKYIRLRKPYKWVHENGGHHMSVYVTYKINFHREGVYVDFFQKDEPDGAGINGGRITDLEISKPTIGKSDKTPIYKSGSLVFDLTAQGVEPFCEIVDKIITKYN